MPLTVRSEARIGIPQPGDSAPFPPKTRKDFANIGVSPTPTYGRPRGKTVVTGTVV